MYETLQTKFPMFFLCDRFRIWTLPVKAVSHCFNLLNVQCFLLQFPPRATPATFLHRHPRGYETAGGRLPKRIRTSNPPFRVLPDLSASLLGQKPPPTQGLRSIGPFRLPQKPPLTAGVLFACRPLRNASTTRLAHRISLLHRVRRLAGGGAVAVLPSLRH
jgi:hypothetical protein